MMKTDMIGKIDPTSKEVREKEQREMLNTKR